MKIYGIINGVFYILFGLFGVFMPKLLAAETMGWVPDLLGLHQIRAIWMVSIGFGVICILVALKGNIRALTQAIIFITLCFLAGRLLGLAIDGAGPQQTYVEIGIEILWSSIGAFLLHRSKSLAGRQVER